MRGTSRMDRDLWDAQDVAGGLVEAGSVSAFLAEHRRELFDDSFTADLFPSRTGRPSLPADLVGTVLVSQASHALSDPRTAEALRFDIRWKVACGRSLTDTSFNPSTLVYRRERIAVSDRPDRVFDKVAEVITETGILKGRRKRCVDSTVSDDAVATQDTVTQLVAAIREVARLVPGAGEVITQVCVLDHAKAGKPDIDRDDPAAKQELVSTLVNDALEVLAALCGPDAPERGPAAADSLGLLALVAGRDVEPAEDSDGTDGRWRIARRVAPDRVISTVDPRTRHTRKSKSVRRDGYRAHLASEPGTGLITDAEMTMATGEADTDAAMGVTMTGRDRFHPTTQTAPSAGTAETAVGGGLEVHGDSAYGGGEAREAYREAGHDTMIKPEPVRPAVPGGFTLDDFIVDEEHAGVTCPGGHTRPMSPSRTVTFGRLCADRPLRSNRTTAKTGRSMTIHQFEALLRAARAQGRTPELKQAYPTRSNVERTVAQVATQNGRRIKPRHLGVDANNAWLRTRAAALNLRTMLKHGLTRLDGGWALA